MTKEVNRITITLSDRHHNYIEDYVAKTNMPKTSIVQLAIEQLMTGREDIETYKKMVEIAEKEQNKM